MKNIHTCDDCHSNVQQGISQSQWKQENEKCLKIKDLNAKWEIWEEMSIVFFNTNKFKIGC